MLGASATMLGQFMAKNQVIIRKIGGVIVVGLGIHFTGIINFGFLQQYKKMEFATKAGRLPWLNIGRDGVRCRMGPFA